MKRIRKNLGVVEQLITEEDIEEAVICYIAIKFFNGIKQTGDLKQDVA